MIYRVTCKPHLKTAHNGPGRERKRKERDMAGKKKAKDGVIEPASMEVRFSSGDELRIEHLPGRKLPMLNVYRGGTHVAQATIKDEENAQAFVDFFKSLWAV